MVEKFQKYTAVVVTDTVNVFYCTLNCTLKIVTIIIKITTVFVLKKSYKYITFYIV